ncbi:suppressor of fused domain protein [Actinomadura sp. HBU206391]|uniref:suppressor of fused domain protein n=1 Tax=Actinomadura sp. HBU206391 TaxID=2731692 RepID=UPI001650A4EF|nr:suppressor of fused domain protein [Actinomadura sp. HBU206391]MBC6456574.1 suppressor of fused domain protein [Actinomadura sp. HBU206391]
MDDPDAALETAERRFRELTDPRRFEGLLDHTERHLGRLRHAEPPDAIGGRNRGFAIAFYDHPDLDMVSAATNGVRFQRITALFPQEYVCSARPGQETEAGYLLHVVADRVVQSGEGHEYEGGYLNAEPLIPDTQICGLFAEPHPYADEEFNLFRDDQGEIAVEFITLVPVTRAEFEFLREHGDEEMFEVWSERETDLLDIYRASAV